MAPNRLLPRAARSPLLLAICLLLLACATTPTATPTLAPPGALTEPPNGATPAALATPFGLPATPLLATGVYADALGDGWMDWSWDDGATITHDLAAASPVHSGSASLAVTYTGGWSGLKLARFDGLDASQYDTLRFWVHGGPAGGQSILVYLEGEGGDDSSQAIAPLANAWTQVDLPLAAIGGPSAITGIVWFNNTGGAQPVFYLDDISLIHSGAPTPTPPPPEDGPRLGVDAADLGYAISPYIYGMNFAQEDLAAELDLPINRWGGNATTRYNYRLDMSNRASDWYFQNIPNDNPNPGALPAGSSSDGFVAQNLRTATETLLTVPLIGWTPKGPRERACGFSVALYGAQQSVAPDNGDCGNGVYPNGDLVTGNNPLETSLAITPSFVISWMQHLRSTFGPAGVRFYNLDNEPMLWNNTHRDVHPDPVSYDELRDRTIAYAAAIKAFDPNAQTLGPVVWGWVAYFYSALDVAAGGSWWNTRPDRRAHDDLPLLEWYLQQMAAHEAASGVRVLDYLDAHYYPQSFDPFGGAGSAATQALRLRSTRALWDPTYVDESWINEPIYLIPRLRAWVDARYPGTKLAITEYQWGAGHHLNGALAQADVLGIFGREGLDLATVWVAPEAGSPAAYAFRMYRNYDGAGGKFGEQGVAATSANQEQLAAYAARRAADGALTVMVINKALTSTLTSELRLAGFAPAPLAATYRFSAASLNAIVRLPDQPVTAAGFTAVYPPQSITLFVLAPGAPLAPRAFPPAVRR
jgi:hypothetical protein